MAKKDSNGVSIKVSRETFERLSLKKMAFKMPFEASADAVIAKLLDESARASHGTEPRTLENEPSTNGVEKPTAPRPGGENSTLNIDHSYHDLIEPPADLLKHTKVLRAELDGRELPRANWTHVRQSVVKTALRQDGWDLRRLLECCPMNAVEGKKTDEGYKYYRNLDMSIQGQDSTRAWKAAAAVAWLLDLSVEVRFRWRAKPDAKHPGRVGILTIN